MRVRLAGVRSKKKTLTMMNCYAAKGAASNDYVSTAWAAIGVRYDHWDSDGLVRDSVGRCRLTSL